MNTTDMTIGDLAYRLLQGRDPPWNNDAAKRTVGRDIYRRPVRLIEWLHATNPLKVRFCECGRLHQVLWSRKYVARILWPKGPVFTAGMCTECGNLKRASRTQEFDDVLSSV